MYNSKSHWVWNFRGCSRFVIPIRRIKFAYGGSGWNMRRHRHWACDRRLGSSANEYREINWANLHINFFLPLITWKSHQLVSARTCKPTYAAIGFIWLIDWLADWLHTSEVSSHHISWDLFTDYRYTALCTLWNQYTRVHEKKLWLLLLTNVTNCISSKMVDIPCVHFQYAF